MFDRLLNNIEKTLDNKLSKSAFEELTGLIESEELSKGVFLVEEGKHCDKIYFIEKGSCYSYLTDLNGEKHVVQFALEGFWISDLSAFFSGNEAIYTIEALEDMSVWSLRKDHFDKACSNFPIFDRFFRLLIQNAYVALQYRLIKTNSGEAQERYAEFSRLHPDFSQRIPQYLIASYLGIKPQSLSRVRNKMVRKKQ